MRRLRTALMVAILAVLPGTAWAGASTDAALGLGAFAVFNQIIGGTGIFAGLGHAQPVYAAPAPPVYMAPPPPVYVVPRPVYVTPRPVYVTPRPVYVAPRPVYVAPRPVIVYRNAAPVYGKHGGFEHWKHHR
jgi:PXPV repeat-containing protein